LPQTVGLTPHITKVVLGRLDTLSIVCMLGRLKALSGKQPFYLFKINPKDKPK
jgi:hypothetical protein